MVSQSTRWKPEIELYVGPVQFVTKVPIKYVQGMEVNILLFFTTYLYFLRCYWLENIFIKSATSPILLFK